MIQERLKDVQKKWLELKAEVSYLDRKRRRARRKEREGQCLHTGVMTTSCFILASTIIKLLRNSIFIP